MFDIIEDGVWVETIKGYDVDDPVEGGRDGVDNIPLTPAIQSIKIVH